MLTFVYTYYLNAGMLAVHYRAWSNYPESMKSQIAVIVVDDASPTGRAEDVPRPDGLPDLRIFRVLEDVPWHQDAARNLGVSKADTDWILITDMDQLVSATACAGLLRTIEADTTNDRTNAYIPARLNAPEMTPYKPHCNSYLLKRETYWRAGGYDEDLCGCYGTDGDFRRRLRQVADLQPLERVPLIRHPRDFIPDASTTTLDRRTEEARAEKNRIFALKHLSGRGPQVLQCAWEQVL